jgi:DNA repair protein RadC
MKKAKTPGVAKAPGVAEVLGVAEISGVLDASDVPAVKTPHYVGHRERLRTRYLKSGINSLSEYEVLELLLTYASPRKDVKPEAKELFKRFNGLKGVLDALPESLTEIKGVGSRTALLIKLVKDMGMLYLKEQYVLKQQLKNPRQIVDYLRVTFGSLKDEHFIAFYLNANNEILAEEIISVGTVDETVVKPRMIFEKALKHKANSIIFVHNHPSGTLKPSAEDIHLTKRLLDLSYGLGIRILDHMIVTSHGYTSFCEKGLL